MPIYNPTGPKATFGAGVGTLVWAGEVITITSPASPPMSQNSLQVGMHRDSNLPNAVSVEIKFAANPGAFQVDLQTADTDEDQYYITKQSMNSGLNSNFVGRMEVPSVVAKYARLRMVTLTNAVGVTAKIS